MALNSSATPAIVDASDTATSTSPVVWKHPSGLTIIHRKWSAAPVVAVQLWVGVGSANENEHQLGMAHVHEHLVFKGTEKRGVGQIAEDVEAAGGSINAWTSLEETVYHVVMPAAVGGLGVDVLLDGTLRTKFDPEEVERELEVIREEIRRGDDVPARSHMEHVFSSIWKSHPYGRRVIGSIESVSAFDQDQLKDFHAQWYQPANMRLVVVGDCSRAQVEEWVEASLGAQAFAATAGELEVAEFDRSPNLPVLEYREVENARVTLAFHGPKMTHPDYPAIEMLCMLIAGSNSSVLYDRLVRKEQLAVSAWSDSMVLRHDGVILAGATFSPENSVFDIIRVLGQELGGAPARLRENDLQRAKRSYEASHLHANATVQGIANAYGSGHLHLGDAHWQKEWMEKIRNVQLEDVTRVAKKWLSPQTLTIVAQFPLSEQEKEVRPSTLLDAFEDGFQVRQRQAKKQSPPDHQGYQQFELENGIRLIVQPDRTLPVFHLRMGVLAGSQVDELAGAGRSSLMTSLLTSGNTRLDTQALERELDRLGANASASLGQTTTVLALSGLKEEQAASLEIAQWCWFQSTFQKEEIDRAKRVRERALIQQYENPHYIAARALRQAFFGEDHPYATPSRGTLESLAALSQDDMRAAHQYLLDPSRLAVSVVGDVDIEALIDQLSAWGADHEKRPVILPTIVAPAWPKRQDISVEHQRKQAVVYVSYPGLGRDDDDAAALNVLTVIMSGQGGRLFKTLREQRSLAYSVSMGSEAFRDTGMVYGRMETSPDKIDEAVFGLREELTKLCEQPLQASEVERAKARIAGQMQVALQTGGTRASLTLRDQLLGRGYRYGLDYPERFQDVTAQQIQRVAQRLLQQDHEIVVVARPART